MDDDVKLPELPEQKLHHGLARLYGRPEFNAEQMQEYARAAALADREERGEEGSIYLTHEERAALQRIQNAISRAMADNVGVKE